MNLVFFAHPDFLNHQSMPRFTKLLKDGMISRGHTVSVWMPKPKAYKLSVPTKFKKWLGYVDQYIFFPFQVKRHLKSVSPNTLFVFCDHALGPWVPLLADKPHAIHCHDFLAQKSAYNLIPQNPTGLTGKLYQKFIRNGYSKGKYFISVSKKTQQDLHEFLVITPKFSKVVYNGLNQSFSPKNKLEIRAKLSEVFNINLNRGYLLHVGGNQWYKNRPGIIEIYNAWRDAHNIHLPLILIGQEPNSRLLELYNSSLFKADIHFLVGVSDDHVNMAYAGASIFLFPSLAEGFGWPIAEAMASGCPVITTDMAPMNEVGAKAAFYIEAQPEDQKNTIEWATTSAEVLNTVLNLSKDELELVERKGIENAKRFDRDKALDEIEKSYLEIFENFNQ